MVKKAEIFCEYQPYIDMPPQRRQANYAQATSNDTVTINTWRSTWMNNIRANHAKYGPFKDRSIGKFWAVHRNSPGICIGSGPSLKENGAGLKANQGIPTISCLHNFHFLEDIGAGADYYVSLDAGMITIEEVSEGGGKSADDYWEITKDRILFAYIGSHPDLLAKWKGEIYFFNCPVPDESLLKEIDEIEPFHTFVSTGGNVLGACTYIAKGVLGCNPLIFMGANFSFSYSDKFHGWDSKYDKNLGSYIRMTDVYGNKVKTWQSYANFKGWFDWLVETVPGIYINATEGGCFGSYPEGNIRGIRQMDLADVFSMFNMCDQVKTQCIDPETDERKILF